jgi:uncharacterized coiled-coil protein SlyX
MSQRKRGQELLARFGLSARSPTANMPEVTSDADLANRLPEERLRSLETRVAHVEATLEGLQDSVYRETERIDEALAELRQRTEPHAMSQALSADARRRGL